MDQTVLLGKNKNIKIIVGSNAGDEGKGLATDYFSSVAKIPPLGVLTNGSSQRAHTVDTKDGVHHIFSHFSSGTFHGADTYISKYFVINPMKFVEEFLQIKKKCGYEPIVFVHKDCKIITPYDILYNITYKKETNTTGCGFWDTLQRYEKGIGNIKAGDFYLLNDAIKDIRYYYDNSLYKRIDYRINLDGMDAHFKIDWEYMCNHIIFVDDSILNYYSDIIFENGQGLLIGEQNPESDWNYCTPSHTGVNYALQMIKNNCINADVEVCYVSRTYLTRHGNGLLQGECDKKEIGNSIYDATNHYNVCQGGLRYGELDINSLHKRVYDDFYETYGDRLNKYTKSIMFTHWNERQVPLEAFKDFDNVYISDGKTAESVKRGIDIQL